MDNKEVAIKVKDYLNQYVRNKIKDKIIGKITESLGVTNYYNLITGNFPAAKLAGYTVSILRFGYFYGYFHTNGHHNWNPYNPHKEDQYEQYTEYLLFSWRRGNPGYIWQFEGVFNH